MTEGPLAGTASAPAPGSPNSGPDDKYHVNAAPVFLPQTAAVVGAGAALGSYLLL